MAEAYCFCGSLLRGSIECGAKARVQPKMCALDESMSQRRPQCDFTGVNMAVLIERKPWSVLDKWRGKAFSGEWPTLPELFFISAERFPERPCFTDFEGAGETKNTLNYDEAAKKIRQLVLWMTANGIKKGDHVAVTGKNSPEWAVTYLAAQAASAVIIPIDYALHENEVKNLIRVSKPKMIFCDEEKHDFYKTSFPECGIYSLNRKYRDTYVYDLKADKKVEENPPADEHDTAAILFTSGTTGNPKGVVLTHKNLVSDCFIAQTNLAIFETDIFYALLPIHHGYTMQAAFINPISVGAEIVFGKSMSVTRLMKELREGQITIMLGVPMLYNKLLSGIRKGIRAKGPIVAIAMKLLMNFSFLLRKLTGKNYGKVLFKSVLKAANIYTLRVAICGGGPLSASVFKAYNAAGIDFIQGYGLTETSPIIALNPLEHFKIESVGRDFSPYMEMKILDPDEDGVGEVIVKGPMVMKGYYNMPEETAKVFTEDGYFKTGDLGWMDEEHYLMLCGRIKNMIVTGGGKNVYPEEIEDAFQLFDEIEQITVQGYVSDENSKDERIEALVYPSDELYKRLGIDRNKKEDEKAALKAIDEYIEKVNKNLQPYARITRVTLLEKPLEMTTTRKVKRIYKK